MTQDNGKSIVEVIREKMLSDFLGKRNAKRRRVLLSHCHYFDRGLSDREMRRIYNTILPVAWTSGEDGRKGIYVVDDPDEVDKAIKTRKSTIAAHEKAIDNLKKYKKYLVQKKKDEQEKKRGQMEIPFEQGRGF